MDTNEPGREPTEPTDAELERRFERWWADEGVGTSPNYGQDVDECNKRLTHAAWMNGVFVASGARPMPDTPAPDEQDATLVKLIDLLTRTANAVKGQPGEMKQHGWADLPELCTALTARVAELEAVKRAADNMAYAALFVIGNQGNEANAIDGLEIARDKYMAVSAPGKEPTSE